MPEQDKVREPDVIEPDPVPEIELDDESQIEAPATFAIPDVRPSGRTFGNVQRQGRQIT